MDKWVLVLPDHSEVPIGDGLTVGRQSPNDAIMKVMALFDDVSGAHLEFHMREGRWYMLNRTENSWTRLFEWRSGYPVETTLESGSEHEVSGNMTLLLGDHAFVQVKKEN